MIVDVHARQIVVVAAVQIDKILVLRYAYLQLCQQVVSAVQIGQRSEKLKALQAADIPLDRGHIRHFGDLRRAEDAVFIFVESGQVAAEMGIREIGLVDGHVAGHRFVGGGGRDGLRVDDADGVFSRFLRDVDDLDVLRRCRGDQRQGHHEAENKREKAFHVGSSVSSISPFEFLLIFVDLL